MRNGWPEVSGTDEAGDVMSIRPNCIEGESSAAFETAARAVSPIKFDCAETLGFEVRLRKMVVDHRRGDRDEQQYQNCEPDAEKRLVRMLHVAKLSQHVSAHQPSQAFS